MRNLEILLLCLIMTACPCPDAVEGERQVLTDNERNFFKYRKGDEALFVHSNGFEFKFTVDDVYEDIRQDILDECGGTFSSYETLNYGLRSANPSLQIAITVSPTMYFKGSEININNTIFSFDLSDNPDFQTIVLAGTRFTNVYELDLGFPDNGEINIYKLYLNKEKGIVQINISNGETYTLID